MIENYKFSCKYDEWLFDELLKINGDIHYTPGEFNEDASIYLNNNTHIQLGRMYVILWVRDENGFMAIYSDNYKSIFDIDHVINHITSLNLF